MNEVYLCLGGNIGNCIANFTSAKKQIYANIGKLASVSSIYKTKAWGMDKAPDFYNQVVKIETEMEPEELLQCLLAIEKSLGRERNQTSVYQNRVIDLDILFFNQGVMESKTLQIPHPKMHLRNFVLIPLQEIAPNFTHPVFQKTIAQLVEECSDKCEIQKI